MVDIRSQDSVDTSPEWLVDILNWRGSHYDILYITTIHAIDIYL